MITTTILATITLAITVINLGVVIIPQLSIFILASIIITLILNFLKVFFRFLATIQFLFSHLI